MPRGRAGPPIWSCPPIFAGGLLCALSLCLSAFPSRVLITMAVVSLILGRTHDGVSMVALTTAVLVLAGIVTGLPKSLMG